MAPEVARRELYDKSADVYSYAMVLFELIAHEVPFAGWVALQAAAAVALHGVRPELHADTPAPLVRLVCACWAHVPPERPSFADALETLVTLRETLPEAELRWLDAPNGHATETAPPTLQPLQQEERPSQPQDPPPLPLAGPPPPPPHGTAGSAEAEPLRREGPVRGACFFAPPAPSVSQPPSFGRTASLPESLGAEQQTRTAPDSLRRHASTGDVRDG